jgi:hypothetical protein
MPLTINQGHALADSPVKRGRGKAQKSLDLIDAAATRTGRLRYPISGVAGRSGKRSTEIVVASTRKVLS